mmetsp:Transcript_941/g.1376  ORF Transcript_941/g.1376 Transcript_941/m.1376 type:complete len:95 (-) Transcript_941:209-493(-)
MTFDFTVRASQRLSSDALFTASARALLYNLRFEFMFVLNSLSTIGSKSNGSPLMGAPSFKDPVLTTRNHCVSTSFKVIEVLDGRIVCIRNCVRG